MKRSYYQYIVLTLLDEGYILPEEIDDIKHQALERITRKYEDITDDDLKPSYVYYELLDSLVDIAYYVSDYMYTNVVIDTYFADVNSNFEELTTQVRQFSRKAQEDYYCTEGELREIDIYHISKMVVSEIYECLSTSELFFSELKYVDIDIETVHGNIFDTLDAIISDVDSLSEEVNFRELFEQQFKMVNDSNMSKVFPDGRFHFIGPKVIKPSSWIDPVVDSEFILSQLQKLY